MIQHTVTIRSLIVNKFLNILTMKKFNSNKKDFINYITTTTTPN